MPTNKITTHAFGAKADIKEAITGGTINEYDEIFTTDTHEIGYIDASKQFHLIQDKTQAEITVNQPIGGFKQGEKVAAGTALETLINKLLVQRVVPTYTQPSAGISNNGGTAPGTYEVGTEIDPNLRATFNQGDAGALSSIVILKNGTPVDEATSSTAPYDYDPEAFVLTEGTTAFKSRVSYAAGEIKQDNYGENAPGNITAGSKDSSQSVSYTGSKYIFYGQGVGTIPARDSVFIRGLASKVWNKTGSLAGDINFATGNQWICVAVPAPRTVTAVNYVQGPDPNFITVFTHETVQVADAGGENTIEYNVWYYNPAVANAADMTLQITIG